MYRLFLLLKASFSLANFLSFKGDFYPLSFYCVFFFFFMYKNVIKPWSESQSTAETPASFPSHQNEILPTATQCVLNWPLTRCLLGRPAPCALATVPTITQVFFPRNSSPEANSTVVPTLLSRPSCI